MAPRENRQDSYIRAARAAVMRASGATWQMIADREDYPTARAAMKAVERHHDRNPLPGVLSMRSDSHEGYRILKSILFADLADARQQGNHQAVVASARVIADVIDKDAKLTGQHAPVTQHVDVTVTETTAVLIDRLEAQLLLEAAQREQQAAIGGGTIIEGEVVA